VSSLSGTAADSACSNYKVNGDRDRLRRISLSGTCMVEPGLFRSDSGGLQDASVGSAESPNANVS
jgi:hypothetical protein